MKIYYYFQKIMAIMVLFTSSLDIVAQGTVNFNNRIVGTLVTHIYAPDTLNPGPMSGNGSNDTPSGTTVYTGVPIGGTTTGTFAGQNYTAQLWALAGTGNQASDLQAVTQYTTTFRTQTGLGGFFVPVIPSSDPGIPNTSADNSSATLQLRVWNNEGGTVTTWADGNHFGIDHGSSPIFDLSNLGSGPATLVGLQSFSLDGRLSPPPPLVPEPSTMVLITLGGVWLGFFWRKR